MKRLSSFLRIIAAVFLVLVFIFSPALPALLEFVGAPQLAERTRVEEALAAPPAYRSSGTFTAGTGIITPPYPADMAADDVCLLAVESENQAISLTTANGFVQVPTWSPQSAGTAATNPASRLALYWKRTVGGDAAPVVADSGNHTTGRIHCFSNVLASGNPWDTGAGGNDGAANDTSATIPGATTTVADTLVVLFTSTSNNNTITANCSGWTNANLANLTEWSDNTNTVGLGGGHCMATGEKATAGSYAQTTATLSVTSYKGAVSLALKPPLPPVGPDATSYMNGTEAGLNFSACATTGCGGRIVQAITVSGTSFGADPGAGNRSTATNNVKIGTGQIPTSDVTAWSATSITFTVSATIAVFGGAGSSGLIITAGGTADSSPLEFWVFPDITSLSITEAQELGATITINGNRFDSSAGTVEFINCAGAPVAAAGTITWGDTLVSGVQVPAGVADDDDSCDIRLTRAAGTGSKTDIQTGFVVLPNITGLTVCATCSANAGREYDGVGDTDGLVMLQGDHFGTIAGTVQFTDGFGALAALVHTTAEGPCTTSGWDSTGTSVCIEVNNAIGNSVYTGTITLLRSGDSKTDVVSLRVLPQITAVSPAIGGVGDVVQLSGDHFCESGACPVSPNRSTAADNVQFGTTQALDADFVNQTGGAGACNGVGASWTHAEACVKVPTGTPSGPQPVQATSNTSYISNAQVVTVRGVPTVMTNAASSVTSFEATLNGNAIPNSASTTGWFRFRTTDPGASCTDFDVWGTRVPAAGGTLLGSGTVWIPYSQTVSGLEPATSYWYCAWASNSYGADHGGVATFTTNSVGGWSFNAPVTIDGDLTMQSGILSGTQDVTLKGSAAGGGRIDLTGGTFEQRGSAAATFGTTAAGEDWAFANLTFSNSSASAARTVVVNTGGTGKIVVTGTLAAGSATDSFGTTFENEMNDRVLDIENLTIDAKGVLTASSTAPFTVSGNWTLNNGGVFNEGTGTVILDGIASKILNSGCADAATCTNENFFNLTVNKTDPMNANDNLTLATNHLRIAGTLTVADGELLQGALNVWAGAVSVAAAGKWQDLSTGDFTLAGAFTNNGSVIFNAASGGCTEADDILLRSSVNGTQRAWAGTGTFDMQDLNVQDQGGSAAIEVKGGTDSGGNGGNWTFSACGAAGGETGELISATFDTQIANPTYNSLLWKGTAGTGKVRFQFASSDCANGASNPPICDAGSWGVGLGALYVGGAACSTAGWYDAPTPNVGAEITCASQYHGAHQYHRYRIQLCAQTDCASTGGISPSVTDVVVSWSP